MPKIEMAIRDAIHRGARRQILVMARPVRREVRRLRQLVAQLRRDMRAVQDAARDWQRVARNQPWMPEVSEQEAKAARLSARLIRAVRRRLGLSQAKLGRIVGVSAVSVAQWEAGRASPFGKNRVIVVGLRKLGRREVKGILARITTAASPAKTRSRVRRRKTQRRRRSTRTARRSKR